MKNKILFLAIFSILGFFALQVPVNGLAGTKVKFTLFDLFAPVSGAFLGTPLGFAAVLTSQTANLLFHGMTFDKAVMVRFLTSIVGVWIFARRDRLGLLVPALAILSFNLNSVGRSVWFYSLFWTIPFIVWKFRERFLVARALSSTFSAHAAGGAIWIWAFNLPAGVWISLIPIVALERAIFALGISASYVLINNILGILKSKKIIPSGIFLDKKYLFKVKS